MFHISNYLPISLVQRSSLKLSKVAGAQICQAFFMYCTSLASNIRAFPFESVQWKLAFFWVPLWLVCGFHFPGLAPEHINPACPPHPLLPTPPPSKKKKKKKKRCISFLTSLTLNFSLDLGIAADLQMKKTTCFPKHFWVSSSPLKTC